MFLLKNNKYFFLIISVFLLTVTVSGKTRWSSLHMVPGSDLLNTGDLVIGFDECVSQDIESNYNFQHTITAKLGIVEWVNFHIGYSDGITCGLKARILGETRKSLPSLAIGVHNLFSHKELNYFNVKDLENDDVFANEVYLVLGKSIEAIKTRIHLGIQSIPAVKTERANPFLAVEKYFGKGVYTSLEMFRRNEDIDFALFGSWRIIKRKLEISLGALGLKSMFFDKKNGFQVSLEPSIEEDFVKPVIWIGLKFHMNVGMGKSGAFSTVEDRLAAQERSVSTLTAKVDSLKKELKEYSTKLSNNESTVSALADSIKGRKGKLYEIIYDKLVKLKTLYQMEPFEPEGVGRVRSNIISYRNKAVPVLKEIAADKSTDRYLRKYAINIIGEIGSKSASDVLMDIIGVTKDPDLLVETIVAFGKMKETSVMYLLEQMANDPHDAVALAAQEVLLSLSEETGAKISEDVKMRKVDMSGDGSIPEEKIAENGKEIPPDTVSTDGAAELKENPGFDDSEEKETSDIKQEELDSEKESPETVEEEAGDKNLTEKNEIDVKEDNAGEEDVEEENNDDGKDLKSGPSEEEPEERKSDKKESRRDRRKNRKSAETEKEGSW